LYLVVMELTALFEVGAAPWHYGAHSMRACAAHASQLHHRDSPFVVPLFFDVTLTRALVRMPLLPCDQGVALLDHSVLGSPWHQPPAAVSVPVGFAPRQCSLPLRCLGQATEHAYG